MDLFKIQNDLIADHTADAWYRINVAGPSFHYRWQYGWSPQDGEFSYVIGEHSSHAVCREEPSLTVSWGMPVYDRDELRELHFEWADRFVDKSVRPYWVDFFWNNALIDRVELCRVDGGHGNIPIPDVAMEVTDFEMAVAYLVHGLEGGHADDPGQKLATIGGRRIRDASRWGAGSA